MEVTLLAFGMITDVVAAKEWKMEGVTSTDEIRQQLETQFPQLREMKYLIAVNKQIAHTDTPIPPGAEVALLPPFSGG